MERPFRGCFLPATSFPGLKRGRRPFLKKEIVGFPLKTRNLGEAKVAPLFWPFRRCFPAPSLLGFFVKPDLVPTLQPEKQPKTSACRTTHRILGEAGMLVWSSFLSSSYVGPPPSPTRKMTMACTVIGRQVLEEYKHETYDLEVRSTSQAQFGNTLKTARLDAAPKIS